MNKIMLLGILVLCICGLAGCESKAPNAKPPEVDMERIDRVFSSYYKSPNINEVIELTPSIASITSGSKTAPICGFYYGLATVAGNDGEILRKTAKSNAYLAKSVEDGLKKDSTMLNVPPEDYSPGLLDFYWGYFLATGDKAIVMKIVKRGAMKVPANCTMDMTAAAARWSSTSLAKSHPVVQAVIDEFLAHATESEKSEFEQQKKVGSRL